MVHPLVDPHLVLFSLPVIDFLFGKKEGRKEGRNALIGQEGKKRWLR